MSGHVFSAKLWEHDQDQPGSWHFVTLPPDVADDLVAESGPRGGFGSISVEVTIGTTSWRTSLFPDSASGSLILPVKKDVRRAEHLTPGVACRVSLRLST